MIMDNSFLVARRRYDPDATRYINAVQLADGQALEPEVAMAIDAFIKGCKADSAGYAGDPTRTVWDALQASCIMCGARTISGALVPLVGPSPTAYPQPVNFVSADYDRSSGLKGDGATKYLDTNRAGNEDGQNDAHGAVFGTTLTASTNWMGAAGATVKNLTLSWYSPYLYFNKNGPRPGDQRVSTGFVSSGFAGVSRAGATSTVARYGGANFSDSTASSPPSVRTGYVFAYNNDGVTSDHSDARLAFYSIGSAIPDLAALDTRVSTLVSAISAAL